MGSEQSSQQHVTQRQGSLNQSSPRQGINIRRQHTIANPGANDPELGERPGSTSPGPSICSDVDLPYISYTVNRPIGDSPKLISKPTPKSKSSRKFSKNVKKSAHNIVVVKPAINSPNVDKDPDILQLQNIPMFLPIMRATLNLPAARDPEVLERLDPLPMQKLCARYQNHLHVSANLVATEQNILTQKIREADADLQKIVSTTMDKQKRYVKCIERFSKVQELSLQLNKCHTLLNDTLELLENLNKLIDVEHRLEPFIWTTG